MGLAVVGQIIVAVASIVIVGAAIRLWARSASRPRRRRKNRTDATWWPPDYGSGAGFGVGAGGSGFGGDGGGGGGDGGGDGGGGGCD